MTNRYSKQADRILDGHRLSPDEALAVLRSPDDELLELLAAVYRVRRRWFGKGVRLNFLVNAKSGKCGEDCGYCSQSRVAQGHLARHNLLDAEDLLDGAQLAARRKAGTYCIVTSGRTPSEAEIDTITDVVQRIKRVHDLKICASVGLLDDRQAVRLRRAGVDRVNHNLNTSRRFYPSICSTHTYEQRLATLETVRRSGMQICSGGIVGMGETDEDLVDLALTFGRLAVEAVPINFLIPVAGTPLERASTLNPRYCLKVLALFRLANPPGELRIAAGRELHLGPLQPLGLYAADSMFVGDYLTTKGQEPDDDFRMIEALGFEIVAGTGH